MGRNRSSHENMSLNIRNMLTAGKVHRLYSSIYDTLDSVAKLGLISTKCVECKRQVASWRSERLNLDKIECYIKQIGTRKDCNELKEVLLHLKTQLERENVDTRLLLSYIRKQLRALQLLLTESSCRRVE